MNGRTQRPELHPELCGICRVCLDGCPSRVFADLSLETDTVRGQLPSHKRVQGNPEQPACRQACPINQDIPEYLGRIAAGDPEGALASILQHNPFPAVLGYVCHHPCETACLSIAIQKAPAIRELKRFASMAVRPEIRKHPGPLKGKVAVIGAGPAGLAAAWALSRAGVQVIVYESSPAPGGLLTWAIPSFRLPRKAIYEDISYILQHGIELMPNSYIPPVELVSLQSRHDAVVLACGAPNSRQLEIPGRNLPGVWLGLDFLREMALGPVPEIVPPVVVIGGGNVATDAARWAVRLASPVSLIYRRDREDMPAYREEIAALESEGIEFLFRSQPSAFLGDVRSGLRQIRIQETSLETVGKDGRHIFAALNGTERIIPARTAILALGQERSFNKWSEVLGGMGSDLNASDPVARRVYTAGDMAMGPATVVEAVASGIGCADRILREIFA